MNELFNQLGGWSALDVLVKQQDVVMNGYTDPGNPGSYLSSLAKSRPLKSTIFNVMPYSTYVFLHESRNDYASWWKSSALAQKALATEKKANINFETNFIEPLTGEMALAIGQDASKALFIAVVKDRNKLQQFFIQLSARFGVKASTKLDNELIRNVNVTDLIPSVFGSQYGLVDGCAYVIVDQYLLVANDIQVIEEAMRYYRSGRTLDLNENFKSFQNNLSSSASFTLYANLRDGIDLVTNYVDPQLFYHLKRNNQIVREFEGLAVQLTAMNGLIYTTAYLKHNPDYKEESLVAWKLNLDAPMSGKPQIVEDHVSGNYDVIVFDTENKMYLIGPEGNILWKKQLSEEPMSDVFVVDYYKNGKNQYLFNTPNYLQLIDRNGNNVANYPVKLRSQATNGVSVFDYNNQKDYRILISCADKLTYNYELRGREVDGWQKPKSLDIVAKPVERLIAAGKDYIIISQEEQLKSRCMPIFM